MIEASSRPPESVLVSTACHAYCPKNFMLIVEKKKTRMFLSVLSTIQDYNTGKDFKFYGKPFYFIAEMDVYPGKGYCRLVGSCIFRVCHYNLKEIKFW